MNRILIPLTLFFSLSAGAVVDMKNASFVDVWTDLISQDSGYDMRVRRGYKSRSLFNGIFGFGWCSDFETKISATPEGNLKMTECGAGLEIIYTPKKFSSKEIDKTISQIIAKHKVENRKLRKNFYVSFRNRLRSNVDLRSHFARKYRIRVPVKQGVTYYAQGRAQERISFANGSYTRYLADNTVQKFNSAGRLVFISDKNGEHLKFSYKGKNLSQAIDKKGRKLTFKYYPTGKVREIVGPKNKKVTYKYKGQDLVYVKNAWGHVYTYKYDDVHNLVRINFPDKTFKALKYNKDKDWVLSFRSRNACVEKYSYQPQSDDPKNHYISTVVKSCKGKVLTKAKYEFWHKARKDGKTYLHRVRSNYGSDTSDITYHPIFGRPISIGLNGEYTQYDYDTNGLVKSKVFGRQKTFYEYKNKFRKISRVVVVDYNRKGKPKKTVKTDFSYNKKGNLQWARNSDGRFVKIKYDRLGRISYMEDQAKLVVKIRYEGRFGKPAYVERPGMGAIKVTYTPAGKIKKVKSKEGPVVAAQVTRTFNNLLDIIAPANEEFTF